MKNILVLTLLITFSLTQTVYAKWYDPFNWFTKKSSSSRQIEIVEEEEEPEYVSKYRSFKRYEVLAGMEVGYQIGARFKANLTKSYYLIGGVGFNASFLSSVNESIITNLGQLSTEDGVLAGQALTGGVVVDIMAGMNIAAIKGLSVQAGYSYLGSNGGQLTQFDLNRSLIPFAVNISGNYATVSTTMHSLKFEANYMWAISNFNLYATIGLIKPVSAQTITNNIFNQFQKNQFEIYLNDLITPLFIPTAALWISYPI